MSGVNTGVATPDTCSAQGGLRDWTKLYAWIDEHEISRPKRNLNRDFSDAVAMAELIKTHWPRLVDLHNYAPRSSILRKIENWETLNRKVLAKIGLRLNAVDIEQCARGTPGAVEHLLERVRKKAEKINANVQQNVTCGESNAPTSISMQGKLQIVLCT